MRHSLATVERGDDRRQQKPARSPGPLKRRLRPGQANRRRDLARWSTAVDRHLRQLVGEGRHEKVSAGVYMVPRHIRFGASPAAPEKLVEAFLGDDRFLMVSPNAYNDLGVGMTSSTTKPWSTTASVRGGSSGPMISGFARRFLRG